MPNDQDWRDVARERGVPVFEGARVTLEYFVHGPDEYRPFAGIVVVRGGRLAARLDEEEPNGERGEMEILLDEMRPKPEPRLPYVKGLTIDLTDPHTRAGYDRDLALALGAPVEAVDEGVTVKASGDYLTVFAGLTENADRSDDCMAEHPTWQTTVETRGANGHALLARVLAWPVGEGVKA